MNISQAFELKDMKKSLVKPYYKAQHPEILKPALWDLLYLDGYVPVIFFYRPEGAGSSFSQKVAHLKESLSKLLVRNYPFAGRWMKTQDETMRELLCNDEGVPFYEARIDEDMDTVIGDVDDYRPVPELGSFALEGFDNLYFQQDVDFPMPPIFFQVTGFKCGGISLYAAFSHQTTDGKGFFNFMADWSQQAMEDKVSTEVTHDRSLTLSLADFLGWINGSSDEPEKSATVPEPETIQTNGNSSKSHSDLGTKVIGTSRVPNATPELNGKHLPKGEAGPVPKSDLENSLRFPIQILLPTKRNLLVRKEAIQDLKNQAIAENPEAYVTTVDCITSHFWRSLNSLESEGEFQQSRSRSRPIQEGKPVEFVLSTAVEARKRCHDPPLPDTYSGNCLFVFLTPRMTPSELLSESHLEAARIFHKTVREINPRTWKDFLKSTMGVLAGFGDCDYRHVLMTSWITFPMYDVEFRQGLGKPFFVGVNMAGGFLPEGYIIFMPPRPSSPAAASIHLGLQDDVLQALLSHKNFRSFFL